MKKILSLLTIAAIGFLSCNQPKTTATEPATKEVVASSYGLDRTVLPIHEPTPATITELDAHNTTAPARFEVKAPEKAPNVVVVLIDDMGFGQSSVFGGPINMPNAERIAAAGIKYNNFHTTALCSPTRVALLTGYNHHSNNAGAIMEIATGYPGNTGIRPLSITPLAEVLRQNGYATAAFGKYHETPPWEVSVSGPYDRWPTHSGFDKFYGFIGGETNQWAPMIYDGTTYVETPHTPNYHFTADMTDQAIAWVQAEKSITPDKPFMMYFATGATHAPHHAPKEYIDKYKGKFDQGWDKVREETLERQKKLGVVPQNTVLAKKPEAIKDWDKLSADEKKLFARQMETFAGFGEYVDMQVGHLYDAVKDMGELDNTLFIYIIGDNGSSAEGGMVGMYNEMTYFNGIQETVADQIKHVDEWGGPSTYPHFAAGWAVAGDCPFAWTKQEAGTYGGTTNPVIMSWPARIKPHAKSLNQFHHAIDIAPTIYEAVGVPSPKMVNGVEQRPIEGTSMVYTWDHPDAKSTHTTQYFEIMGNRGIYSDGWFAGTIHRAPWEAKPSHPLNEDVWELYYMNNDFSQANDLAKSNPQKLKELEDLFMKEGAKYNVLPIDDRMLERLIPKSAGRPDLIGDRTSFTVYPGMKGMTENAFINIKNLSFTTTATLDAGAGNADGVLLAQGGRFGGWSIWMKNGKPMFTYNYLGLSQNTIASSTAVKGNATIVFDFVYDGGGPGKGGMMTISTNGKKLGEGRIDKTQGFFFSADDAADVGMDEGTEVANYGSNKFTGGKINKINITIKPGEVKPLSEEEAKEEVDQYLND